MEEGKKRRIIIPLKEEKSMPVACRIFQERKEVEELLELEISRYERYGVEFTLAVFWCGDGFPRKLIKNSKRMTDHFIAYDDGYVYVVYAHSSLKNGHKACQNIISEYERQSNHSTNAFAGITCVSHKVNSELLKRARTSKESSKKVYKDVIKDMMNRVHMSLDVAKRSPISTIVDDYSRNIFDDDVYCRPPA